MENWDNNNLPENHILLTNVEFLVVQNGTWKRKKQDGTEEVAPKWDYVSRPDDNGESITIGVFSSTDHEQLEINKKYDLIVKKAVGKDGTFYGYSLKGFAPAGTPIPKKEPQSRWQKGQKLNAKAEALKAAASVYTGSTATPDEVIEYAQVLEAYLDGSYTAPGSEKDNPKSKK